MGSPKTQRLLKQDDKKIEDLQSLQWQIINYWQINGEIPANWSDMKTDFQTGKSYEYKKTGTMNFKLCAVFNKEGGNNQDQYQYMYNEISPVGYPAKSVASKNEDWRHTAGNYCFEREIDPIAYPTQVRG
jgi:hypothetical protein